MSRHEPDSEIRKELDTVYNEKSELISSIEELKAEKLLIEEEMGEAARLWSVLRGQTERNIDELKNKSNILQEKILRMGAIEKDLHEKTISSSFAYR